MNIMFFLTPKGEVTYIYDTDTIRQALEKMEHYRYNAVPVIDRLTGRYVGTLTEGDLLWYIKEEHDLTLKEAEHIRIGKIPRKWDNKPVSVDAKMEDLLEKVTNQNFVPVHDDEGTFIGIITRRQVISYLVARNGE